MIRARLKSAASSLLLALLLTGCGARNALALPETAPAEPLSAPAAVTAGRTPETAVDLPTEAADFSAWMRQGAWGQQPVGLLAELPEQDAALYGVHSTHGDTALLRWGDSLAAFDWSFGGPRLTAPQVQCWDTDRDGQEEIVFIHSAGSGTGVSIEALHVVEKAGDGTLTGHGFPQELWREQLSGLLSVTSVEGRSFVALGTELVEVTGRLEGLDLSAVTGADTGDIARFEARPGAGIFFSGSARVAAEGYAAGWYVAEITADVSYQDGTFTLSGFHLDSFDE